MRTQAIKLAITSYLILGIYPIKMLKSQDLPLLSNHKFNHVYADSLLWERINDLRVKNNKKRIPPSFGVRRYISKVNSTKLKERKSCFHPHWSFTDAQNRKASAHILKEMKSHFNLTTDDSPLRCSSFSYTEVAAATWGYTFDTYNEMAKYFAQMWWDSKGHKEILYEGDYGNYQKSVYMIGVSIQNEGNDYYAIANVIGYHR